MMGRLFRWVSAGGVVALLALAGMGFLFREEAVGLLSRALAAISSWGVAGAAAYPAVLALCNLLLLPGGVLAVSSGFFFGLWWGFALSLAGHLIGLGCALAVGRRCSVGFLERLVGDRTKVRLFNAALRQEGWKIVFLTQVHPLFPTSLFNYLYGVARLPWRTCLGWAALGQAPGLFLYVYFGTLAQHGVRLMEGRTQPRPVEYVIWFGGLALALVVTAALSRVATGLVARIDREAGEGREAPVAPEVAPAEKSRSAPLTGGCEVVGCEGEPTPNA